MLYLLDPLRIDDSSSTFDVCGVLSSFITRLIPVIQRMRVETVSQFDVWPRYNYEINISRVDRLPLQPAQIVLISLHKR
jgi:hypothetical protein